MKTFPATAFFCSGLLFSGAFGDRCSPAQSLENELIFGCYIYTLRNLKTQGVTLAYRFWLLSDEERGRSFSLLYPWPLSWGAEIRGGRLNQPEPAWEGSLSATLKYELDLGQGLGWYLFGSAGGCYSEANYISVPTNYNFILRAGLGLRLKGMLLQGSYEHRSNGSLRSPNRGLDVLEVAIGFRF